MLIWLKTAPPMPYWAEKVEVWIWTSCTVSKIATSKLLLCGRITDPPSAMMLKYIGMFPLMESAPLALFALEKPGRNFWKFCQS